MSDGKGGGVGAAGGSRRLSRAVRTFGIAPYWSAYRPGVPPEVARVIVEAAGAGGTLLDLGTGTGQVVRALAPYFDDIIAVDPVKELLDQSAQGPWEQSPLERGPLERGPLERGPLERGPRLRLVHAAAEEFVPPAGWTADLVTICRAFHWMDRPAVLARLAKVVAPAGVLAIFHDRGFWGGGDLWGQDVCSWKEDLRAVIEDFVGHEHARPRPDGPPPRPYAEILAGSAFNDVAEVAVPVRREWTIESILGYLYSTAFAARSLLGDRVEAFEDAVARALADHSSGGTYVEDDEFAIWLARRPR